MLLGGRRDRLVMRWFLHSLVCVPLGTRNTGGSEGGTGDGITQGISFRVINIVGVDKRSQWIIMWRRET